MSVQRSPTEFVEIDTEGLGGKVKPSDVIGAIGDVGSVIPVVGPVISLVSKIGKGIAKLFGGSLTQKELDMAMEIHRRVNERERRKGGSGHA